MWWGTPIYIVESFSVAVENLPAAQAWYEEKLGMGIGPADYADDSGAPCVALQFGKGGEFISLVEVDNAVNGGASSDIEPIFFSKNVAKAREWLLSRGITPGAIQQDSGGNSFFTFQDLDENVIEVCKEP